jgi:hypothetical protein
MTDKEQQIRVKILPQLDRFVSHLWDNVSSKEGRKLEQIVMELELLLNDSDD